MASVNIHGLERLPAYLRELKRLREAGTARVSSSALGRCAGVDPLVARKDLEMTGASGKTGVGYPVPELIGAIEKFLGWESAPKVFLVGTNGLVQAVAANPALFGFQIAAAFEQKPASTLFRGIPLYPVSELSWRASAMNVKIAVLGVPDSEAEKTAEYLAVSGIQAIWNFTNVFPSLRGCVLCVNVNLPGGFAVLTHKLAEKIRRQELS